ncbi:MAG: DinB family protein [Acidimicrobiales bacterium]
MNGDEEMDDFGDPGSDVPGDSKDWTWVLERTCPECAFDVRGFDTADISAMIRENAGRWTAVLESDRSTLTARPRPDVWSPLEYAFHVRDVFELYDQRLEMMLTEDGPHYPNWDQDETALQKDYPSAEPEVVAAELADWAERLAGRFETVEGDMWERTGFRSDGAAFTVESFARYLIHDPVHHLWDVRSAS